MTSIQQFSVASPVDLLLSEISAGHGISAELWTDEATLDATVPMWRFELTGSGAVAEQLSHWFDSPMTIDRVDRRPLPGGELVELDLSGVKDGMPYAVHQMHVLALDGDRICADIAFCGGRWPAALLAEMEAARVH